MNNQNNLTSNSKFDSRKIEEAVRMIIDAIGEDPNREGLQGTPGRIARMYEEIFAGLGEDASDILSTTFSTEQNGIVMEKDITFYSMCEHHFMPFYGKAHIAYIPNGRVAGLSKLARTVEVYARRPQIQERMTDQIAEAIINDLDAQGAIVVLEAEHMCMTMRGVKKPGSKTITIATKGCLDSSTPEYSTFMNFIRG